jgi:hypothetical protein
MDNFEIPAMKAPLLAELRTPRVNRAKELAMQVLGEYQWMRSNPPKGKTLNLVCTIGGTRFDVYSIGNDDGDMLRIKSRDGAGNEFIHYAPVEMAAFTVMVLNETTDEPPREIGFAAEMKAGRPTQGKTN